MMITEADPQRQWFLYFQEREIGPLNESEVLRRLESGEINATAYVYSEGMPDWALISETPVLSAASSVPTPSPVIPTVSLTSVSHHQEENTNSTNNVLQLDPLGNSAASASESNAAASSAADAALATLDLKKKKKAAFSFGSLFKGKTKDKAKKLETATVTPIALATVGATPVKKEKKKGSPLTGLLIFVGLILVAMLYMKRQANTPDTVGNEIPKGPLVTDQSVTSKPGTTPAELSGSAENFPWEELSSFRQTTDPKGAPFRIASKHFGAKRPVLVGALSPLVKAEILQIAIFSDSDRSLLAVPKVWILKAPVVDGYFSSPPLTVDGKELPPGLYHFMAAHRGDFLGEVTFEVSPWPAASEVSDLQSRLGQERLALAQKEKGALEVKLNEITAAVNELKSLGKIATTPGRGAADWKRVAGAWLERVKAATNDQRNVLSGPMFYADAQGKLYGFMAELGRTYDALDLSVKSGAKAVTAKYNKGLGQIWVELGQRQAGLAGEIQSLPNPTATNVAPLKIDPAIIKRSLTSATAAE